MCRIGKRLYVYTKRRGRKRKKFFPPYNPILHWFRPCAYKWCLSPLWRGFPFLYLFFFFCLLFFTFVCFSFFFLFSFFFFSSSLFFFFFIHSFRLEGHIDFSALRVCYFINRLFYFHNLTGVTETRPARSHSNYPMDRHSQINRWL